MSQGWSVAYWSKPGALARDIRILEAARTALKQWQDEPLFEFYAFEAKCPQDPDDCSDHDFERLEAALERAREEGDTRARRIEKLLIAADPMPFLPPPAAGSDSLPLGPEHSARSFSTESWMPWDYRRRSGAPTGQ